MGLARWGTALAASALVAVAPLAPAAASTAQQPPGRPATRVLLITGDVVTVGRDGTRPTIAVALRTHAGIAGTASTVARGSDLYVFPGAARRYLGRVLDPSLFDITRLARQRAADRVPVVVRLAPGTTPHVPGLTVTARNGTSERGYLSAAGARAFGAALAARWRADAAAHRVPDRLFGGVTDIAAPGAAAATPRFRQYTLIIRVTSPAGKPADFALVSLTNVDDGRKFSNFLPVYHGLAKVSVPAGHYSGLAEYDAFLRRGVAAYLVPREEVPVTSDNTVLRFDTRTATTVPSVRTPRPAAMQTESLEWDRTTKHSAISYSTTFGPGSRIHVAPSGPPPPEGTLHWVTNWQLAQDPAEGAPYTYDLAFDDEGSVPADQTHVLSSNDLAQINARYYTDQQARLDYFGRAGFFPFQFFVITDLLPLQAPTARTEYVNATQHAHWSATLISGSTGADPFQGFVFDNTRAYLPGEITSADWLRGPLAPGVSEPTPGGGFFCGYCRKSGVMALLFAPYVDTTPGHAGTLDVPRRHAVIARFTLYRDGVRVLSRPNSTGAQVHVPAGAATYRAVVTAIRGAAGFATSTSATEVVKFRSSASSGAPAPAGWFCPGPPGPCTVLPLLTATVPLPTDLQGTMPRGTTRFVFSVRHVAGAAEPAIRNVTFALTVNNGATYHQMPVTALGQGRYQVTIRNPPVWANHGIGIRIHATDAAGGALTETVANAYYVAQS